MPILTGRRSWKVRTRLGRFYHKRRYGHFVHPCGVNQLFYPEFGILVHDGYCNHDGDHVCDCGFSWAQVIQKN